MSFEMMCFVTVIVMGVAIAIYGAIKVNGGVQPKMAAKQAPPSYLIPQPTAFNTSSNFIKPTPIGKPLVIQNWDRLIGMVFPTVISNNQ